MPLENIKYFLDVVVFILRLELFIGRLKINLWLFFNNKDYEKVVG